jgi:hypothetical protein
MLSPFNHPCHLRRDKAARVARSAAQSQKFPKIISFQGKAHTLRFFCFIVFRYHHDTREPRHPFGICLAASPESSTTKADKESFVACAAASQAAKMSNSMRDLISGEAELDDEEEDESFDERDGQRRHKEEDDDDEEEARKVSTVTRIDN